MRVRTICPLVVMSMSSSFSVTVSAPTTLPVLSPVFIVMMPLPPRFWRAVIVERRPFADPVFARDQKHRLVVHDRDRHDVIALVRPNAPNADGVAALVAQLLLVKAQAHAFGRDEDDLVVAAR